MSVISRADNVSPSLVKFSKGGYTYGPNGKIVYCDYEHQRTPLNVMFGPCDAPFGISSYDNDPTKLSVTVNLDDESKEAKMLDTMDAYLMDTNTGLQNKLQPTWTPQVPSADYVTRCYTPSRQANAYGGGQVRFTVRLCQDDPERIRPLLLAKEWQDPNDHSQGYAITRLEYTSWRDLEELFPRHCKVHVLGRLVGVVFQRQDIRLKWDAVQIIKDTTVGDTDESADDRDALYNTIPDLSFLR